MAETIFYTTFSTSHSSLSRAKNGSESGLRSAVSYRFGFNGKENDNEVKGTGNQQDYGMRIYDPRIARFLSADPLIEKGQKYPWYSPYQFAGNKPILYVDIDGLEEGIPKEKRSMDIPTIKQDNLKTINNVPNYLIETRNFIEKVPQGQLTNQSTSVSNNSASCTLQSNERTITVSPATKNENDLTRVEFDATIKAFETTSLIYENSKANKVVPLPIIGKAGRSLQIVSDFVELAKDPEYLPQAAANTFVNYGIPWLVKYGWITGEVGLAFTIGYTVVMMMSFEGHCNYMNKTTTPQDNTKVDTKSIDNVRR